MSQLLQTIRTMLALLAIAFAVASCTGNSPADTTAQPTAVPPLPARTSAEETLTLIYWQAPSTLNPHLAFANRDLEACRLVYEPLASFDKDGKLVPFLAEEIPSLENGGVARDGRSVTWKLKRGLFWSDGQDFTAEDVRFTWQYISNPDVKSDAKSTYDPIKDVQVIDLYTVKVIFHNPNPTWAQPFIGLRGLIIPKHIFEQYNNASAREAPANMAPIGTGPYKLVAFKPQETLFLGTDLVDTNKIIFEANSLFREIGKPFFKRVEIRGGSTAPEAARRVLEVTKGTDAADYAWNLQVDETLLKDLEARGNGKVLANLGPNVERISLNFTDPNPQDGERSSLKFPNPYFSDLLVRQAFTLAINRDEIAGFFPRQSKATSNVLVAPPGIASSNTSYEFNLEKAAALLDQAGWRVPSEGGTRIKDGRKLQIVIQASTNTVRQLIQQSVRTSLTQLNIEVTTLVIDGSLYGKRDIADPNQSNVFRFYADMQILFDGNSNPDPDDYLKQWTSDPDQIPQPENNWKGLNFERWRNPEYDRLYAEFIQTIDPQKRKQLIIQMNDLMINDVAFIPLVHRSQVSAVRNSIQGVDLTPWDADVWNIMDWRRVSP